jgi:anti-sigma regulatory factor (Ser/Thr protein kinase)
VEMTGSLVSGSQLRLPVSDKSHVGECRRTAQRLGDGFNFDATCIGRACIIATELANNIVLHAGSGELLIQVLDDGTNAELEILAIDQGPGMRDVSECLRDGYSTAGTAGAGLGAVARLSSTFDIFSNVGQGTVVLSRTLKRRHMADSGTVQPRVRLEIGAVCLAVAGEIDCGDAWCVAGGGAATAILVADGLGHGTLAARASQEAVSTFKANPFDAPSDIMKNLHRDLAGGRGAAAACAQLQFSESKLVYSGVGNISGSVATTERSRGMVSHNGTLGVQLLRTQQFEYDWPQGSRVVMHSDGLSARWSLASYPGLQMRHAAVIAAILYRDFVRRRDDVTVVVGCHR